MTLIGYVELQHLLRSGANDPQIQMAEDTAAALGNGLTLTSTSHVDMQKSLDPFVIVYDQAGQPATSSSSGFLQGVVPQLPQGVLESVKGIGEDRITWEPQSGVSIAAVVTSYVGSSSSGYVLAGKNLRETERRDNETLRLALYGWIISVVLIGLGVWMFRV